MNQPAAAPARVVLACQAMATRFEFVLFGDDEPMLRDAGEAAINDVLDAHNRLTRFERTSIVSAINAHAGHRPVRIDDELFDLLTTAERIRIESNNAFDITLGSSELVLNSARRTVMLPDPAGSIDLGGIGKGHALDLATETLRDAGVQSALLHGGTSTFAAVGHRPGGEPWAVSIAEALEATLANESLSVSNAVDGSSAHREHIVGAASIQAAAVKHASAAEADARSTALVAGSKADIPQHAYQTEHRWHTSKDWDQ